MKKRAFAVLGFLALVAWRPLAAQAEQPHTIYYYCLEAGGGAVTRVHRTQMTAARPDIASDYVKMQYADRFKRMLSAARRDGHSAYCQASPSRDTASMGYVAVRFLPEKNAPRQLLEWPDNVDPVASPDPTVDLAYRERIRDVLLGRARSVRKPIFYYCLEGNWQMGVTRVFETREFDDADAARRAKLEAFTKFTYDVGRNGYNASCVARDSADRMIAGIEEALRRPKDPLILREWPSNPDPLARAPGTGSGARGTTAAQNTATPAAPAPTREIAAQREKAARAAQAAAAALQKRPDVQRQIAEARASLVPGSAAPSTNGAAGSVAAADKSAESKAPATKEPGIEPGKGQLVFVMWQGVRRPINGVNGSCYSSVITLPAPPGWGHTELSKANAGPARAVILPYLERFRAACARQAPLDSDARYDWNHPSTPDAPRRRFEEQRAAGMIHIPM